MDSLPPVQPLVGVVKNGTYYRKDVMPSFLNGRKQGKHLSNIGLRRQQNSRRSDSTSTGITTENHSPVQPQRLLVSWTGSNNVEAVERGRIKSRHKDRKEVRKGQIQATSKDGRVDLLNAENGSVDTTCESEENSPSIIVVNPDLNVLPVEKTEQARGAFDFCT